MYLYCLVLLSCVLVEMLRTHSFSEKMQIHCQKCLLDIFLLDLRHYTDIPLGKTFFCIKIDYNTHMCKSELCIYSY
jgi:hypothetical protein